MIFLDNSSSSFFKPPSVITAVSNCLKYLSFNPSRAGHSGAIKAGRLIYSARKNLAEYFNCPLDKVILTSGCTESLNLAILGSCIKGGHVITTPFQHNSVLRPLYYLKEQGLISLSFASNIKAAEAAIRKNTYLMVLNHVSNVTGSECDITLYGKLCKKYGISLVVDAAQSAGHIKIDMDKQNISYLAIAPHKGLHAAMGVGALMLSEKATLSPIKFGGTGTASYLPLQPNDFPEGFEAGTPPLPAIASLNAGLKWTKDNFEFNAKKLRELSSYLIDSVKRIAGLTVYSSANPSGIVALNINGYQSQQAGDILNSEYDIAVRCGFHCAPLLHKYYGTEDGMIRASIGCDNTYAEIDFFIEAIKEMAGQK